MSTWREVLVEVTADALEATRRELAARTHAIVGRLRPVITAAFRAMLRQPPYPVLGCGSF
jgi:hypothetical protein